MKNKISLILFLVLPLLLKAKKEDFLPPIKLPPSPTEYELRKYGFNDAGLFTGSADITVTLYQYASGKLNFPISLRCKSNGIKVDQLLSNVETITSDQQKYIDAAIAKSNIDTNLVSEELLRISLESLRKELPLAIVMTYTCDPLVEMTSVTDPRRETIYYKYDEFERLKFELDSNESIVNKLEYHYKNK